MKDFDFKMAQFLRQSHCDKAGEPGHEFVGQVTIKRGEVCLNCQLCGDGQQVPGWSSYAAERLAKIFGAAGIRWDALDMSSKLAAINAANELGAHYLK